MAADVRQPGPEAPAAPLAWPLGLVIGLLALTVFGWGLSEQPAFIDESAYYSQSYFARLYVLGEWDDPHWLSYPALDLAPVPKYLIGGALGLAGYRAPTPADAQSWYGDTSRRFDPPGALLAARIPIAVVGALGCVALYALGVTAAGRGVGLTAALVLMANPLYRLHARRAMSDVPCEAFLLLSLAFFLAAWERRLRRQAWPVALLLATISGASLGLSVGSKLSGIVGALVIAVWASLGFLVTSRRRVRSGIILDASVAGSSCLLLLLALNPFLTAHPRGPLPEALAEIEGEGVIGRLRRMADLRLIVSRGQQQVFAHNAVRGVGDKGRVVLAQGFGRFGPFGPLHSDSTRRYSWEQDAGAALWFPLVIAGAAAAAVTGRRQSRADHPPAAWALLTYFLVALGVVTAYLPMAWDRYFLPIQSSSALLAALALAGLWKRLRPGPLGTET